MSIKKYYFLAKKTLFPLNRSLTGKGIKQTLKIIKNEFPKLKIKKIKAGAKVFDWKIPEEWNISDAFIIDKHGDKIIDFKKNNLHVVGYSKPINRTMGRDELINKLFSLK